MIFKWHLPILQYLLIFNWYLPILIPIYQYANIPIYWYTNIPIYIYRYWWPLGFRKLKSPKVFQVVFVCLQVCKLYHEKENFFFMEERNCVFFLIFTMKLSSAALSYLKVHPTLNFARTFLYFQTLTLIKHQRSKVWILSEAAIYFGSSRIEVSWKLISGNKLSDLPLYFTDVYEINTFS